MHIVVCVKQVPDTTEVKVNPETGTLIREGVPSIINPFDQFAIEEGLRLRDKVGGEVTVISMGPPQAKAVILLGLALGADRGILLTDRAFAGADTLSTAYTLSKAIQKLGKVDLVLCGMQAVDGDTAQVGPGLASTLKIPQIAYAETLEVKEGKVRARRTMEDYIEVVETRLPALCTMTTPSNFVPTDPPFSKITKAKKKPYAEWTAEAIGADPGRLGLKGSPTWVKKVYSAQTKEKAIIIKGSADETVAKLVEILKKEHFL